MFFEAICKLFVQNLEARETIATNSRARANLKLAHVGVPLLAPCEHLYGTAIDAFE